MSMPADPPFFVESVVVQPSHVEVVFTEPFTSENPDVVRSTRLVIRQSEAREEFEDLIAATEALVGRGMELDAEQTRRRLMRD